MRMRYAVIVAVLMGLMLSGCATTGNPKDPLEPLNRKVFAFNDAVDTYALQPVARGYVTIVPQFLRTGVSNVFSNLDDALIGANNLFQGKPGNAVSDFGRLLLNSTVGFLGVFDVATPIGLEKHEEDIGQTLGVWGFGNGPYLVLPLLGPSSLRDTSNLAAAYWLDPVNSIDRVAVRNSVKGLRLVDGRAQVLDAGQVLEEASLDKYAFMRDFYLQRRRSLVHDGRPPREKDEIEDEGGLDAPATPGDFAPVIESSSPASSEAALVIEPADSPEK